jgi:hypothetical protein
MAACMAATLSVGPTNSDVPVSAIAWKLLAIVSPSASIFVNN